MKLWSQIALCFLIAQSVVPTQAQDTTRILFVGNSYTYYHSIPYMVKALAESQNPGLLVDVKFVGGGGATLENHWEAGRVQRVLDSEHWDFVVLQEQSLLNSTLPPDELTTFTNPELFFSYARQLDASIKEAGATAVYYMTWSRKHQPEKQQYLTYAYTSIARETGSRLAPVGLVWDSLRDSLSLYTTDGSHPSALGSYLAAASIYATLFDQIPEDLPGSLTGFELLRGGIQSDSTVELINIGDEEASAIQRAVRRVHQTQNESAGYFDLEPAMGDDPNSSSSIWQYLYRAEGQLVVLALAGLLWWGVGRKRQLSQH